MSILFRKRPRSDDYNYEEDLPKINPQTEDEDDYPILGKHSNYEDEDDFPVLRNSQRGQQASPTHARATSHQDTAYARRQTVAPAAGAESRTAYTPPPRQSAHTRPQASAQQAADPVRSASYGRSYTTGSQRHQALSSTIDRIVSDELAQAHQRIKLRLMSELSELLDHEDQR